MANAMVALANLTLSSAQATITFGSIPATYRDLRLVISNKMVNNGASCDLRVNNDSGSNYANIYVYALGSGGGTSGVATTSYGYVDVLGSDTTSPSVFTVDIMDYAATDKHKSILSRGANPTNGVQMSAIRWASTSAITSITLSTGSGNYAAGSTFALYGIVS